MTIDNLLIPNKPIANYIEREIGPKAERWGIPQLQQNLHVSC